MRAADNEIPTCNTNKVITLGY